MAIDFDKKTWGTYTWNDELTVAQNVSAARAANALIETADLQRIENAIGELAEKEDPDLDGYVSGLNGVTGIWKGTQTEYNNLETPDPNVLYVIVED